MIVLIYLFKTIIISGLLCGYYLLFLRNKQFHQYNRFYLLSIPLIALLLPLFNIPFPGLSSSNSNAGLKILKVITVNDWEPEVVITAHRNWMSYFLNWQNVVCAAYIIVALVLSYLLMKSVFYIIQLSKKYSYEKIEDIKFFQTTEPGTPFSFLKNIFWNHEIEIKSEKGNQVFRHELYHVKQKHTNDILFIESINIVCWFNPFFYLIKKEIKVIHEFLADQYAASSTNKYDYAELLVLQSAANKQISITNYFFHNEIKRRIMMITTFKNTRYGYISRVMALPLLFIIFCAFGMKITGKRNPAIIPEKIITKKLINDSLISPKEFIKINPNDIKNITFNNSYVTIKMKNGNTTTSNRRETEKYFKENNLNLNGYKINADARFEKDDTVVEITSLSKKNFSNDFNIDFNSDTTYQKIYTKVEFESEYPGGKDAWSKYLNTNLKYPEEAQKKEIQGIAIAQFIVNTDGSLSDIKIIKSPNKLLSDETLRIIKKSGKWKPAVENGQQVRSYKKQPIHFMLTKQN